MLRPRRRRRRQRPSGPGRAALERTRALVEVAKEGLVSAAPRGRPSPVPLAEALAAFEDGLREARLSVEQAPESESWPAAAAEAIEEALRRAEHLRLEVTPRDYGELVEQIDRLLEPLVAFEDEGPGAW